MPQMAPMNWTLLFTMFISLYLITLVVIYFISNNSHSESYVVTSGSLQTDNLTWKW